MIGVIIFIVIWFLLGHSTKNEIVDFFKDLFGDIGELIISVLIGLLALFLLYKLITLL
jgi:hypothetical protein